MCCSAHEILILALECFFLQKFDVTLWLSNTWIINSCCCPACAINVHTHTHVRPTVLISWTSKHRHLNTEMKIGHTSVQFFLHSTSFCVLWKCSHVCRSPRVCECVWWATFLNHVTVHISSLLHNRTRASRKPIRSRTRAHSRARTQLNLYA